MLVRTEGATYEALRASFKWRVPREFNIGTACADTQAADELALLALEADGSAQQYTFGDLAELSGRLASGLRGIGIEEGDRVGIVLPQRLETALAHLSLYKIGAVAVPLSGLFGPDALQYRLGDCGAKAVITDHETLERVEEVADTLEGLQIVVVDGEIKTPLLSFWELVEQASSSFEAITTKADSPALLIYTSGTTGPPKGALHGHRALLGHLPGFELMYDFFPEEGDVVWTPADWAWIGGLMDALLPAWYHGRPVVGARRRGFDPEWAVDLMAKYQVRNAFLPPTALKLMREADVDGSRLDLRSVMSGGEPLGEEMLNWGRENLGVTINEIYGQTEANIVVGNCSLVWPVRAGSMGRPYPGHDVTILTEEGEEASLGEQGEIAVRSPDPVMFLEYWNRPGATDQKYRGEWMLTGDLGKRDEDGYFWFISRKDDVIISAGYRIGPAEIEECLLGHPAVAMTAVIGVPDEIRGQVVKAFVKLSPGFEPSEDLEQQIRQLVRDRLAAYEYPREIEFIDELPLTTTGKIRRVELRRLEGERKAEK